MDQSSKDAELKELATRPQYQAIVKDALDAHEEYSGVAQSFHDGELENEDVLDEAMADFKGAVASTLFNDEGKVDEASYDIAKANGLRVRTPGSFNKDVIEVQVPQHDPDEDEGGIWMRVTADDAR